MIGDAVEQYGVPLTAYLCYHLALMDAEDVSLPDRLEAQVTYLENHREIMVLGTGSCLIDPEGNSYPAFSLKSKSSLRRTDSPHSVNWTGFSGLCSTIDTIVGK